MKKLLLIGVVLSTLTACKQQGDTKSPKGVIMLAVQALYEGKSQDFVGLLTGNAADKLQTEDQQKNLLNSLGNVRKLTLGDEVVVSQGVNGNSRITLSEVPVQRNSQILYTVSVTCTETTYSTTRTVCPRPPSDPSPGHGGGGWEPTPHDPQPDPYPGNGGGHGGGGGITPGPSNPDPGGGKGGEPGRPPRFGGMITESYDDCYDVIDTHTSVSCKISDIR